MNWNRYYIAKNVEDALGLLQAEEGAARVVAGGTDLVLQQRRRVHKAHVLVDISRLPGLDQISVEHDVISIGALVTHAQAAISPLIQRHLPALAQACARIGSPQIRNMGTLVGNIVSAQPGADAALALYAYNTTVKVREPFGERTMDLPDLYAGLGLCCVDSTREIITRIIIPVPEETAGSAFERLSQRHTLTLPVINTAVFVQRDSEKNIITSARITIGPVSPRPFRASAAEDILVRSTSSIALLEKAAEKAAEDSRPRDSLVRGSSEYRKAMVAVLVRRALERALNMRREL